MGGGIPLPAWLEILEKAVYTFHNFTYTKDGGRTHDRDTGKAQLAKQGYSLKKSRAQTYTADNQGGYMIVQDGIIQAGERFDMTLEDVEKFITE